MRNSESSKLLYAGLVLITLAGVGHAATPPDRRVVNAAKAQDWSAVRALVKQRADVNTQQPDGATALQWAAHWDSLDAATLLLQAGANVNAANELGVTALALAAENGSAAMVRTLLAAGADPNAANQSGETVLMTAANTGNLEAVTALLAKGANPNAAEHTQDQTALMWAAAEGHGEVVAALIKGGADIRARSKGGSTPLLFAARSGDLASARALIDAGADVNESMPDGNSALLIAAASGHGEMGVLLLDHGADPNAVTKDEGIAPLHALILKRPLHAGLWKRPAEHMLLAKALLAHGANPNTQLAKAPTNMGINVTGTIWPGATPLMLAARVADMDMIQLLAEHHADPRVTATNKTTALMAAAGVGRSEGNEDPISEADSLAAVKFIAKMGSDLNAADTNGVTALHGAVNNGYNAVIQFLFDNGANLNPKDKDGWTPLNVAEIYRNNFREHKESAALLRKLGAIESTPPPTTDK
jgi:ankyrin repeat protein